MPLYEYQCQKCEKTFEIFQKSSSQQEKVECPYCKTTEVKKIFSPFASGFSSKSIKRGSSSRGST